VGVFDKSETGMSALTPKAGKMRRPSDVRQVLPETDMAWTSGAFVSPSRAFAV
jgi:hypothetical protein